MKAVKIVLFVFFVLITGYLTIADGAQQPNYKTLSFWSDFPKVNQVETGGKGIRNDQQQSEQTLWFCFQASERTPEWFEQNYSSIDDCTKRNLSAKPTAMREIRLVRSFEDHEETIGYGCMADAIWDNCNRKVGFCHWAAVMDQYNACVRTAETE